jgi:hypothetical protein
MISHSQSQRSDPRIVPCPGLGLFPPSDDFCTRWRWQRGWRRSEWGWRPRPGVRGVCRGSGEFRESWERVRPDPGIASEGDNVLRIPSQPSFGLGGVLGPSGGQPTQPWAVRHAPGALYRDAGEWTGKLFLACSGGTKGAKECSLCGNWYSDACCSGVPFSDPLLPSFSDKGARSRTLLDSLVGPALACRHAPCPLSLPGILLASEIRFLDK